MLKQGVGGFACMGVHGVHGGSHAHAWVYVGCVEESCPHVHITLLVLALTRAVVRTHALLEEKKVSYH